MFKRTVTENIEFFKYFFRRYVSNEIFSRLENSHATYRDRN